MITPDQLICPATQLPCHNKAYMVRMLEGLAIGQASIDLADTPAEIDPAADAEIKGRLIAGADSKRAAVEKDLNAACNGSICGPLAQTATRFIHDGMSVGEILGTQQ